MPDFIEQSQLGVKVAGGQKTFNPQDGQFDQADLEEYIDIALRNRQWQQDLGQHNCKKLKENVAKIAQAYHDLLDSGYAKRYYDEYINNEDKSNILKSLSTIAQK